MTYYREYTTKHAYTLVLLAVILLISHVNGAKHAHSTHQTRLPIIYIFKAEDNLLSDEVTRGIIDYLKQAPYIQNRSLNYKIESGKGNSLLIQQIANKLAMQNSNITITIGATAAQAMLHCVKQKGKSLNLIFASVVDPLSIHPITAFRHNHLNVSCISNFVRPELQIQLFRKIQPNLQKLGIIYNPKDTDSKAILKNLKNVRDKFNLEIIEQEAIKSLEVVIATSKLTQKADAIFISDNNLPTPSMKIIFNIARRRGIPVYACDKNLLKLGALAAFGADQYQIGKQAAKMAVEALYGKKLNLIPIKLSKKAECSINKQVADKLGLKIGQESEKISLTSFPQDILKTESKNNSKRRAHEDNTDREYDIADYNCE